MLAIAPAVALERADPDHLDALAAYFEHQARVLRLEADHLRDKARRATFARQRREAAGWRCLLLGARAARLHGHLCDWRAVADRLGLTSADRAQYWAAAYRKRRRQRDQARRDLAVWKAAVRGEPQKRIAARFDLTARRVRAIIQEAEARASRPV